ncbi:MAG: CPBP family intramembrane metalloprotease [Leptolyngbya sp. PLA2]|nr:CPBP family intramembrane metalloprotease [Leptolyngbya sp.]MCE7971831.1 CPBP family intramembrane metalloprotease [Leptolyngbya sp. PL-A2]MCZ7634472.1 CPBP family intramembrane metalloprotease [Phycisphaerales bacterium]MDL1904730.1 CPBP family intramembrane metalloprotease [Synechococcales cyanobacterium CNB]GIK19788.1 MAG: hypothetical protein BroJett004_19520 [Planctomycetota bacterium]
MADWRVGLLAAASALVLVMLWAGDAIRPGSLQRSGERDLKPFPWPIWLFPGLLTFAALALTASAASAWPWLVGPESGALRYHAAVQGATYLIGGIVALGLVYMMAHAAPNAGLRPLWSDLPIGMGLYVLALPLVLLSGELAVRMHASIGGALPADGVAHPTLALMLQGAQGGGSAWVWALIAAAVVGAPLVEEMIYRVFLQSSISRATGLPWVGILAAAVVFAVAHAVGPAEQRVPWYAAVPIGVLGLACGLAYERTKRLLVPITMHACFNAMNVAMAMWATGTQSGS